jgi:hypothetical protein
VVRLSPFSLLILSLINRFISDMIYMAAFFFTIMTVGSLTIFWATLRTADFVAIAGFGVGWALVKIRCDCVPLEAFTHKSLK